MTIALKKLPDSKRIIAPLRLIFWGIIICLVGIRLEHFDIINDFVGMVMISWGVILLSRISISDSYRQWMLFVVIVAIISTIVTFFVEVLCPLVQHPLEWIQTPRPNIALTLAIF